MHCTQRAIPSGTTGAATWHIGNGSSGDAGACYGTEHRAATLAAMLAMVLYFPTAVLYGSAVLVRSEGRFADAESDVNFSADFAVVEKVLKIVLVGVSSFGSAFEGGTVTLCTALAESAVLLWLLQGRGGGEQACPRRGRARGCHRRAAPCCRAARRGASCGRRGGGASGAGRSGGAASARAGCGRVARHRVVGRGGGKGARGARRRQQVHGHAARRRRRLHRRARAAVGA